MRHEEVFRKRGTVLVHHGGDTRGITLDSLLVSKKLEQQESLDSSVLLLHPQPGTSHSNWGLGPNSVLDPSLYRGSAEPLIRFGI